MNAIEMLKTQHEEAMALFGRLEKAGGTERREIRNALADALAVHMEIEEQIFYPATNRARTEDLLLEAVEEHLAAKRAMADLMATSIGDKSFHAKVKVCKELVEHHKTEEEKQLFPQVQKLLDEEALEELGAQMESLAAELLEGKPREAIPKETDAPARLD
jgi:hemerythrin superfamily protein